MPSFAGEVKNELARLMDKKPCCRRAEVAGLLRMGAAVTLGAERALGLSFATENAAVARKALILLKEAGPVETELTVSRFHRLKKNNSYMVRIVPSPAVEPLLVRLGMTPGTMPQAANGGSLLRRACCRAAYLRGAFLGGGSVNRRIISLPSSCNLCCGVFVCRSASRSEKMRTSFTSRKETPSPIFWRSCRRTRRWRPLKWRETLKTSAIRSTAW